MYLGAASFVVLLKWQSKFVLTLHNIFPCGKSLDIIHSIPHGV